jgi:hypothetical protein
MNVAVSVFLLATCVHAAKGSPDSNYIWRSYGADAYHDALSPVASSPITSILWRTPLDSDRSYYGDEVLIHYASPVVTASDTIVHSYRFTTTVNGSPDYDNWRVLAHDGKTGGVKWMMATDYSAPVVYPSDWTSVYPLALYKTNGVAAGGGGGTVLIRADGDATMGSPSRVSFYSKYANYSQNPSQYQAIKICTPLTTDGAGNIWYGYTVTGNVPPPLGALVGTGGVVHISPNGSATFKNVASLNIDGYVQRPALNASPALSRDGKSVYFSICDGGTYDAYLVKLDASTLAKQAVVQLQDPSLPGYPAGTINESSASPMVGPDGHVFYGVFGYYWRESHGWMLQFDANLDPNDSHGHKWPTGSFGWDDTPSVVPSGMVASYTGSAAYLILTKYNNYAIGDGDGVNKVAVLDPSSDSTSRDRQSGIPVMNEILTVVGPTPDPNARANGYPNAVCEWCINSAAVDPATDSAIINSEDGHCYRWSFASNSLVQGLSLAPATGEAYTSTVIGPNGTCYAINNSVLFAVGKL